jgi:hypothetical protein
LHGHILRKATWVEDERGAPQQAQIGRLSADRFSALDFGFKSAAKNFSEGGIRVSESFLRRKNDFFATLLKPNRRFLIRQPPHLGAVPGAR